MLKAAAQLCSGEHGKVSVTPRMQPVQLFNKAFEPAEPISAEQYRDIVEAAWPAEAPDPEEVLHQTNAEKSFWALMARERKSAEAAEEAPIGPNP